MKPPKLPTLLYVSAILTLIALALMVWSVLQPTPLPTILAMSLGQAFGTGSLGLFILAIILDLRRDARERKRLLDQATLDDQAEKAKAAAAAPTDTDASSQEGNAS